MAIKTSPGAGEVHDSRTISASLTDPERFAEIFHRHWDEIHRYIARRLGPEPAEDVGAETFTVAFRNRGRYDLTRTDARPWLYGIATNLIGQHRRAERRRHRLLARTGADRVSASFTDSSDARVTAERLGPRVASVLAGLPAGERDLLLLIAWADLTYEEAAEALGVPMGTVRSRLHRVRKKIRRAFGDIDPTSLREAPE
ncbi:RNA polymerase sigma factor [Actinoallomurus bryophytorum]|uniref:RNA polymerase sigma-70 factor (ECF subfamily) n=1 Tax=Actinoallomurus bryophytorum TaxID=1490222 RepID=A0A543CN67_9ACTN|nr:RNA polymerase sigma factor [Actinoallomurus bryophytorum]TQL98387.1 RNA polymerase sigma-70 factor (ECF subfamily) [Actinoallomurus bryophytorum]